MNVSHDDRRVDNEQVLDASAQDALVYESEESLRRSVIKMSITVLIVLGAVFLIHFSPVAYLISDIQGLKQRVADAGGYGPFLYILPAALLVAGGLPRLFMSSIAGALFGFKVGFLFGWIASAAGSYMNFLLARWGTKGFAQRFLLKTPRLKKLIDKPGVLSVFLARQLPIWAVAQNMAFATTNIKHRIFLLGTLVGILPTTVIMTLIGSGIGKSTLAGAMNNLGWAMALLALLAISLWQIKKRMSFSAQ